MPIEGTTLRELLNYIPPEMTEPEGNSVAFLFQNFKELQKELVNEPADNLATIYTGLQRLVRLAPKSKQLNTMQRLIQKVTDRAQKCFPDLEDSAIGHLRSAFNATTPSQVIKELENVAGISPQAKAAILADWVNQNKTPLAEVIKALDPDLSIDWLTSMAPHLSYANLEKLTVDDLPEDFLSLCENARWLSICGTDFDEIPETLELLEYLDVSLTYTDSIPHSLQELTHLNCSQSEVRDFPITLTKLKYLECHSTEVCHIPEEFIYLETLDCSSSRVQSLPEELDQLKTLECIGCKLKAIPYTYTRLVDLNCTGTNIEKLPKELTKLEKLTCARTDLTELPMEYRQLVDLDCSMTQISSLPSTFSKLQNLVCVKGALKGIPDTYTELTSLTVNESAAFQDIPEAVISLRHINCAQTNVKRIPGTLKDLEELDMESCPGPTALPPELTSLKKLSCSGSKLNTISDQFTQLEELRLGKTYVKELPDTLTNLQMLTCTGRRLKKRKQEISIPLEKYPKIRQLQLQNISIHAIPETCIELRSLDCSKSYVKVIPRTLTKLKTLIANNCELDKIPDSLVNLRTLEISYTEVSHIPETLTRLQQLSAIRAPLEELSLPVCSNLQHLNICHTKIKYLPYPMFGCQTLFAENSALPYNLLIDDFPEDAQIELPEQPKRGVWKIPISDLKNKPLELLNTLGNVFILNNGVIPEIVHVNEKGDPQVTLDLGGPSRDLIAKICEALQFANQLPKPSDTLNELSFRTLGRILSLCYYQELGIATGPIMQTSAYEMLLTEDTTERYLCFRGLPSDLLEDTSWLDSAALTQTLELLSFYLAEKITLENPTDMISEKFDNILKTLIAQSLQIKESINNVSENQIERVENEYQNLQEEITLLSKGKSQLDILNKAYFLTYDHESPFLDNPQKLFDFFADPTQLENLKKELVEDLQSDRNFQQVNQAISWIREEMINGLGRTGFLALNQITPSELQSDTEGTQTAEDILKYTEFSKLRSSSPEKSDLNKTKQYFKEWIRKARPSELSGFIQAVTANRALQTPLMVVFNARGPGVLITARTCFNEVEMPCKWNSQEEFNDAMHQLVISVLSEVDSGFHFA